MLKYKWKSHGLGGVSAQARRATLMANGESPETKGQE